MQVPAPFDYERATSVEHAIGLLAQARRSRPDWSPAGTACCR